MKRNGIIIITIFMVLILGMVYYLLKKIDSSLNNNEFQWDRTENEQIINIPNLCFTDEKLLECQGTEDEGFELQGEIAYESGEKSNENIQLGDYKGLTYYSQVDNRWRNNLYTSTRNSAQTIGSSGCGPASAAMVISSIKGEITPDEMAKLYVNKGYRSVNNGTYWSAFRWTADAFNIEYQETYNLDKAIELVKNNNYVIVSCGNGLFTTGGHFIVLIGIEGDTLKIYDSYLYNGKFNTSTRRGKVTVSGNTIYCSIDNFRKYSNCKGFFAFKNENKNENVNTKVTSYSRYVRANGGLNVRIGPGINYTRVDNLKTGTKVTVYETNNNWSRIGDNIWICSDYLYEDIFSSYRVKVTANSGLNIRKGPSTSYLTVGGYSKGTIAIIIEQNNNWGRTNRGWICLDYTVKD